MERLNFGQFDDAPERFRKEMEEEAYDLQRMKDENELKPKSYYGEQQLEKPTMPKKEALKAASQSVEQTMRDLNVFKVLNDINVNEHAEKKGKFTYLSWTWGVSELLKNFPAATWEVKRFDGLPYLKTDTGYYVEVEVDKFLMRGE